MALSTDFFYLFIYLHYFLSSKHICRVTFILIPDNQCSIRITRFSVKFTVLVLGRVGEVVPELQSQLVAQLRPPVPAQDHVLHLRGVDDQPVPGVDLFKGCFNVLLINATAAIVNQNCTEPKLQCVKGCRS